MSIPAARLDIGVIRDLAGFYRRHLLDDIMPFWEARTADTLHGGYFTCFGADGRLLEPTKYVWFQGRNLWMFSTLCRRVEPRPVWLELARQGRDFLVRHAYAGKGRWHYQLSQDGQPQKETISIYTDEFVLAALCEYAAAVRSDEDIELIRATYDAIERNTHDPEFKDIFHGTWSPRYKRHGLYMMGVSTAAIAALVLGAERTRPLIDHCLEQILHVFAKDDWRLLFESLGRDGQVVDEPEGRLINPGHALESMWFCMEEGRRRNDRAIVERAVEVADWMYRFGRDPEYGGIVSFRDANGLAPEQTDWHRETGVQWHDKVWWVHCEALYTLAMAAIETQSTEWLSRFLELHAWCQRHFPVPRYGEWYAELHRDGSPKAVEPARIWKGAYHLPRALLGISELFSAYAGVDQPSCSAS